jgi:hypothetical protein
VIDMTKEMPLYTCHKRVRALEIKEVHHFRIDVANGAAVRTIVFEDRSLDLPADMFTRYIPVSGDFYVVYEDGYESFSPRNAFLDGYTETVPGNVLMERLSNLADPKQPLPAWLATNNWADEIARLAREAHVTINSLKLQLENLKREKADPDQS